MGGSAGKLFHALKNPEDEALLSKSFVAYDKDKSGSLEGDELRKFGEDCLSFLRKDSKKEHFFIRVTVRGMIKSMNEHEFINWCIAECDSDKNGRVTFDEFKHFVATHSSWESFQFVEGTMGRDVKDSVNGTLTAAFTGDTTLLDQVEARQEERKAHAQEK